MPRLALIVEYDGTRFVGWQSQRSGRSVQTILAAAVSAVADRPIDVCAAGRTDAGVHALGQVVHFDCDVARTARQWLLGINSNLPDDVAVHWVGEVEPDFDARRSAVERRYRYSIHSSRTRPAIRRRVVWWIREVLDAGAMTAAAVRWLGERDFTSFRAANCQSTTPMRCLTGFRIQRRGSLLEIEFTANAFLYHMVRNLVGALVEIGRGRHDPRWAAALLEARDRRLAPPTAPASGLCLVGVRYPDRYAIPASDSGIRAGPTRRR
jgi:tRNA pseudouridine38-40 synthase